MRRKMRRRKMRRKMRRRGSMHSKEEEGNEEEKGLANYLEKWPKRPWEYGNDSKLTPHVATAIGPCRSRNVGRR